MRAERQNSREEIEKRSRATKEQPKSRGLARPTRAPGFPFLVMPGTTTPTLWALMSQSLTPTIAERYHQRRRSDT